MLFVKPDSLTSAEEPDLQLRAGQVRQPNIDEIVWDFEPPHSTPHEGSVPLPLGLFLLLPHPLAERV